MRHRRVDRRVLAVVGVVVILTAGWRVVPRLTRATPAESPGPIAIDADILSLAAALDAEIDRLTVRSATGPAGPAVRNPFSRAPAASAQVSVVPPAAPVAAPTARRPEPPVLIAVLTTEHEGRAIRRAAVEVAHRVSVVGAGDTVGAFVLAEVGPSAIRWRAPDGTVVEQPTGWPHSRHRIFTPVR